MPLQSIQPPTGLNLSSKNKGENWELHKQEWRNYEIVVQPGKQTEEYRIALFLYSIGLQTVKTYNSFDLCKEEKPHPDAIIMAFNKEAIRERNYAFQQYLFNRREQQEGESNLAQSCNSAIVFATL